MNIPKPLVVQIPYLTPLDVLSHFHHTYPVLLESTLQTQRGRYSFLAVSPFQIVDLSEHADPFDALTFALAQYPLETIPDLPPFQGGIAGMLGYELGTYIEHIPRANGRDQTIPDLLMGLYDVVIAWDHTLQNAFLFSSGYPETTPSARLKRAQDRLAWAQQALVNVTAYQPLHRPAVASPISSNFTAATYQDTVRRVQEAIRAGDIFQANLTQRFQVDCDGSLDSLALYARLSAINPAPFAGYLAFDDHQIISASPERLVSLHGQRVQACPIKGTIARHPDPRKDQMQAGTLLQSQKDRAENVMIVDLLRNDLSRVCLPGGVAVTKLCQLESFATVHHLVSEIEGLLAPQQNAIDVIKAVFPGGSITGAPKIRAMEIIADLEGIQRGPYCGSMGYIGFNGDMDLSILIRTFVKDATSLTFHAGGAITLDSDPLLEYQESCLKAEALKRAIRGHH